MILPNDLEFVNCDSCNIVDSEYTNLQHNQQTVGLRNSYKCNTCISKSVMHDHSYALTGSSIFFLSLNICGIK